MPVKGPAGPVRPLQFSILSPFEELPVLSMFVFGESERERTRTASKQARERERERERGKRAY